MISIEGLTVEFGAKALFDGISYVVNKKDRIALVGKNGAGKSTMLKIIAGLQEPTRGQCIVPKDLTIGYLPQHMIHNDDATVYEEAEKAFAHILQIQEQIEKKNILLCERDDFESDSYHSLIEEITHLNEQLAMLGGVNYVADIERTLFGLGFLRTDLVRPTKEFSGGWRMRIELAKLLLQRPDVLLLDEPTNHLDIESIQWLESFLASRANAVMLVSHDKAFINAVTTRTIEISLGKIYDYRANYSTYLELRKERREQQLRAYENQQKQIQDTEEFIERFRYKTSKAVQVQSRIKQLEKIDRLEVDEEDTTSLRLKFPPAPRSGSFPIIAENLAKLYGNYVVFSNIDLTIKRGEKVAFVGKNGEGKSTLVKCIMDEIDYAGKLTLGHNVQIGYFAQNQASLLNESKSVFETIDDVAVGDIRTKIRDILGAFMFGGEEADKKVKVLSGGERSRLAMIRLLLHPVNLLILDEPTNHLDIRSKDVLKQAIKEFDGTVIVVSHDREFLDGLVTKVYEFADKKIIEHIGGVYDFLQKKKLSSVQEIERKVLPNKESSSSVQHDTDQKLTYEERKERIKILRKAEKILETCEHDIAKLEKELETIEQAMLQAENAADVSFVASYTQKKRTLEQKYYEWELLAEDVETKKSELSN